MKPLLERVALYDTRDRVLATSAEGGKDQAGLKAQSKEGLALGLAVTVRYRLEPSKLDYVHAHLPSPVEQELVPPVVASVFRELVPRYTVREVFAARRAEVRDLASQMITQKLAQDGILVKEVMLRDIALPAGVREGAGGAAAARAGERAHDLRHPDQGKAGPDRLAGCRGAEGPRCEGGRGEGAVRVLQAKAEADAMQHTLPLKQKQIEQTRLEAEARKEASSRTPRRPRWPRSSTPRRRWRRAA